MGALTEICCSSQEQKDKVRLERIDLAQLPARKQRKPSSNKVQIKTEIQNSNSHNLCFQDFQLKAIFGVGGFATVYLAQLKSGDDKRQFALKQIAKAKIIEKNLLSNLKLQKRILTELSCNFIAKLYFTFQDSTYFYLALQSAMGGCAFSLISAGERRQAFKQIREEGVRFVAACVILSLEFLHSKNVLYRDLKPQNVLLFSNGYAKLTDFGLSKKLMEGEVTRTFAGTSIYLAPQLLLNQSYSYEVDFWTLGIFLHEMAVFAPPWTSELEKRNQLRRLIEQGQQSRSWGGEKLSDELKDLINKLLVFDPKARLGCKGWNQIKKHPFFSPLDWNALASMELLSPLQPLLQRFPCRFLPLSAAKASVQPVNFTPQGWSYFGAPKDNN